MRLVDVVYERMMQLLQQQGITLYRLAMNGGIPYSTLSTMQKSQTVTLATVYAICIGFGMTLSQFFDSDLFAEEAISD